MQQLRKKIGIDARFYGPSRKGLGRYTQEIVDRVVSDRNNDYVVFLSCDNFDEFKIDGANVKKVLADVRWYTFAEQFLLPRMIAREKLDLMHWPHFNVPLFCPVNFVVTIHDLILTKFPTVKASTLRPVFYWFTNLAYRLVISSAVYRAKKIIAVSQFTKDDLIKHFRLPDEKIVVTHLGVAQVFTTADTMSATDILSKYGIKQSFLLYVGNAYPHKNLEGLIKIFPEIKKLRPEMQLVLVGKDDYFYDRVKAFAREYDTSGNDMLFPGFVPDADLIYFYRHALAYVFPSQYEGFGLPPLEAMALGCPVISSNKASMPEILGDAALYFNPNDEIEMISQILKMVDNDDLRNELLEGGKEQVKKYDWGKCAEETLKIYKQISKS
jgi:glycosyltransferase involved in cell wall biosynthesis